MPSRPSRLPTLLIVGGIGATAIGAGIHVGIMRPARAELDAAPDAAAYDAAYGRYNASRVATIGLYATAATLVTIGIVGALRSHRAVLASARPVAGGGIVTLEWSR